MSDTATITQHYRDEHARLLTALPGADNAQLRSLRQSALDAFAQAGFPTRRQEEWKYTALKPLEKTGFSATQPPPELGLDALSAYLPDGLEGPRLTLVDGHFSAQLSRLEGLPGGATLSPIAQRLASDKSGLDNQLGAQVNGMASALTNMNAAFMSDGLLLELARDTQLDTPLHLLIVSSGRQDNAMSQLRHIVRLGANSKATLIEHHVGLGTSPYFCNAVMEADIGPGASLERVRLQQESAQGIQISSLHARLDRDASLTNHGVDLGGQLVRVDTNVTLDAPGGETSLYGVYVPGDGQHIDNHTRVDHAKPHGTSREIYRGIMDGKSRGVFNGMVMVHPHAQKTDSYQATDALVLSKRAEVDAKPELEIYADDVKCEHGATVGQLDEQAIFYLRSRGVSADGARAILTYSFADELIKHIQPDGLQRYIEAALMAKLPGGADYAGLG